MPTRHRPARAIVAALTLGGALAAVALSAPASSATSTSSTAPKFSTPYKLPTYGGGEPSIAIDPRDSRNVYVTAPQGVPAALGAAIGAPASVGVGFWASHDGGKSFPGKAAIGAGNGGGDSDVEVGLDHTVYVADLEATAAAICVSKDYGKTFTSGNAASGQDKCNGVTTTNQQGPENDRQWLSRGKDGEMYLTYHDFSAGFPIIERSNDHGASFTPCGTILDPQGPAGKNYTPSGGTLVARPVVGGDGTIYVEVTEPDVTAPPVGAKLNHLFLATAKGCNGQTVFKNTSIYTDPGAELGKIFNAVGVDGAGTVYVVAGGITKAGQPTTNVWLFTSHDHGSTWAKPVRVNTPDLKANVMPAVVGGLGGNQVAISWFGTTTSGDPNTLNNKWKYYAATSFDGGKTFQQTTVTPNYVHYGDICTQGVFCGLVPGQPGNRNLADFASIALDPKTGCAIIAFPGDPQNQGSHNDFSSSAFVTRQTGGRCLAKSTSSSHPDSVIVTARPDSDGSGPVPSVTPPNAPAGAPGATHGQDQQAVKTKSVADRVGVGAPWLLALAVMAMAAYGIKNRMRKPAGPPSAPPPAE
jgi:hypothetical protein